MATQKEITQRVQEIYEELKKKGKVRFNRDFLGFTGLGDGEMSSILNKDSARPVNLPKRYYDQIIDHWNINREYLLKGKGQKFNEPEPEKSIMEELNENIKILIRELKKFNAR